MKDEQQDALERARQGDVQALGFLLESYRPYVRVLVRTLHRNRLQSRLDDSDLIQDALLQVQQSFASFRGQTVGEFVSFLHLVVVRSTGHTLQGHLDAARRDVRREQPIEDVSGLVDPQAGSPSSAAIRQEQAVRMANGLARLPDDMQRVLLGRHVDGFSYAELAVQLGRSEGATRVLYTRALRRLREECREE